MLSLWLTDNLTVKTLDWVFLSNYGKGWEKRNKIYLDHSSDARLCQKPHTQIWISSESQISLWPNVSQGKKIDSILIHVTLDYPKQSMLILFILIPLFSATN